MIRVVVVLSLLWGGLARAADDDVLVGRDRGECPDRNAEVAWELKGEVTVGQTLRVLGQLVCERYLVGKEMMKTRVTLGVSSEKVSLGELRFRVESALRANGISVRAETVYRPVREAEHLSPPPPASVEIDPELERSIHCGPNRCEIARSYYDKLFADTAHLARGARIVPSIHEGRPNGFKLYAIRPSSVFGRLGLQNGDTVQSINGMELTTPEKALELYTKIRTARSLTVMVLRRGQPVTLEWVVK